MGLGESIEGKGGGGSETREGDSICSICLDVVISGGGRSIVKLSCGHEFHLDCVGSAFNAKGSMQCPNCRNVEKGSWLYANGNQHLQSITLDELAHDDELYDLSFLEMPYTIRWCPVNRIGRVTSSIENGEALPSVAFQDIEGHNVITELPSVAVPAHPCPHISHFHQVQSASVPTFHTASDGANATSLYYHQWNQVSEPAGVSSSPSLHSGDPYFHGWDRYPSAYSHPRDIASTSIQAQVSHAAPRGIRLDDGGLPRPDSLFYSVLGRHGSSQSLPMLPNHHRNNQGHTPIPELHRQANISGVLWPSGNSSFAGQPRLSPANHFGFYVYPFPVSFNSGLGNVATDNRVHFRRSVVRFLPFTTSQRLDSMESGNRYFS